MSARPHPTEPLSGWRFVRDLVIAILLVLMAFAASLAWAEGALRAPATNGPYRGITKVELFTNWDTQLKLPKNPPFELKVYRMDAFAAMNQDLENKTPRGLTYDQKKAWQVQYRKEHKAETDRWMDMFESSMVGSERLKQYNLRFRVNPGVVINEGQWAGQGEPDLDKVIAQFQKERKQ